MTTNGKRRCAKQIALCVCVCMLLDKNFLDEIQSKLKTEKQSELVRHFVYEHQQKKISLLLGLMTFTSC